MSFSAGSSQGPRVQRAPDLVWRLAADRVLVRSTANDDAAELAGTAAVVWLAADDPADVTVLARHSRLDVAAVATAVDLLLKNGWLRHVTT